MSASGKSLSRKECASRLPAGAVIERWAVLHSDGSIGVFAAGTDQADAAREMADFQDASLSAVLARVRLEMLAVAPPLLPASAADILRRVLEMPGLDARFRREIDVILAGVAS